ncbi:hypothetical protein ILYODFUR_032289 [Ilyodon furcidens]|uniref:Uncharacterized protein n=1 Tax=Ilyodon furcidens TaxID=33524 RepID=A0ABV0UNW0_9TELE
MHNGSVLRCPLIEVNGQEGDKGNVRTKNSLHQRNSVCISTRETGKTLEMHLIGSEKNGTWCIFVTAAGGKELKDPLQKWFSAKLDVLGTYFCLSGSPFRAGSSANTKTKKYFS